MGGRFRGRVGLFWGQSSRPGFRPCCSTVVMGASWARGRGPVAEARHPRAGDAQGAPGGRQG
eukprot:11181616-Lingulodinium_polyedra.AAC.1